MVLLILSFIAGVLTITAPCVFTLLPVIVGGSVARSGTDKRKNLLRPLIIAGSLVASVIIFTLALKATTSLLGVPAYIWQFIAGGIIIALGLQFFAKETWAKLVGRTGAEEKSNRMLGKAFTKDGYTGDILTGAALGPVFSSCSPTYAFVVATILPVSFLEGMAYLLAYALGLGGMLLVVSYAGQSLALKLGWLADPNGMFRRVIGIIFILVGVAIILGLDKKLEAGILNSGILDGILDLENRLRP